MAKHFDNKLQIDVSPAVEKVLQEFLLPLEKYEEMSRILNAEMERGLKKSTHSSAIVKMFPSYVRDLPRGDEEGHFLALDLGGTNFRVLLITLHNGNVSQKDKIYEISDELRVGHGDKLFDFIAGCIHHFREEHGLQGSQSLGFTFSFPCAQYGLREAHLSQWTKGFTCGGVVGQNVADLLDQALKRRGEDVSCLAVLNDTVGTLMSCAIKHPDCMIGAIFGTGTNACYVENLDLVELWELERDEPKQIVINTEWGAFGSDGAIDFIRTEFDRQVDGISANKGQQIFEKMISGMYLGELVRRVLVHLIHQGALLGGQLSQLIDTQGKLFSKHVSEIERDWLNQGNSGDASQRWHLTRQILHELGYENASEADALCVAATAHSVARRAAYLSGAALATLVRRINSRNHPITIGIDGSLFKYHPSFAANIEVAMKAMLDPALLFKIVESTDGSGKGAGVVAAVAESIARGRPRSKQSSTRLNAMDSQTDLKRLHNE